MATVSYCKSSLAVLTHSASEKKEKGLGFDQAAGASSAARGRGYSSGTSLLNCRSICGSLRLSRGIIFFTAHEYFGQGAPCTGLASACSGAPALGRGSSSQAAKPRAEPSVRARGRWQGKLEPPQAARAREPVLRRLLRPALFWAASACFLLPGGRPLRFGAGGSDGSA